MRKNNFETLRDNLVKHDVKRTVGYLEIRSKCEQADALHFIKRNQFFSIHSPHEFKRKHAFVYAINEDLDQSKINEELSLYFQLLQSTYEAMEYFYNKFDQFYSYLEKENKAYLFLPYIFTHYANMINADLNEIRRNPNLTGQTYDTTLSIPIPNRDDHFSDIDSMTEYYANFVRIHIMFYKFRVKVDTIQVVPNNMSEYQIFKELEFLFSSDKYEILTSYNAWINGSELLDLVNLFDWKISKQEKNGLINYIIKPKKERMREYVSREFGLFLYTNLKHIPKLLESYKIITPLIKSQNYSEIVLLEYNYVNNIFVNEYYINNEIFQRKHNGYSLKTYVLFYLIIKVHFFYFLENPNKKQPIFVINFDFILHLIIQNIHLFDNEKELDFIEACLNFYTNNGEDLFNYPIIKHDFSEYLILDTIISANTPRVFLERFLPLIQTKIHAQKGVTLETNLLFNRKELFNRGIVLIKNFDLIKNKKKIGEIDFLIFDGEKILIAELKNQIIPNNTKERYERKKELRKKAVQQIKNAKQFLLDNKQNESKKLGINLEKITEIIPIVITTLDEFHNILIDETLVVSAFSIKIFFENDHFMLKETGIDKDEIVHRMYFNNKRVTIDEFIKFVKLNKAIKMLKYFKDKKLKTARVISYGQTSFLRTILRHKK